MKSVKHILVSTLLALTLAVSLSAASANSNAETQNDLINNGDFALEPNIDNGDYDSAKTNTWFENAGIIKSTGQECPHKIEWTDGYITFSGRTHNTRFFHYNPGITLTPGTYTLSFDVKTAVEGEVSNIRFAVSDVYVQKNSIKISNEWTTVTADFEVNTTTTSKFSIYGGTAPTDIHSFCLDNFTLVQTSVVEPEPIDMTVPLSISEPLPQGNLLKGTDFDT